MGSRMSAGEGIGRGGLEEVENETGTGDTTDSSSSSDEEMFSTNLEVTDLIIVLNLII